MSRQLVAVLVLVGVIAGRAEAQDQPPQVVPMERLPALVAQELQDHPPAPRGRLAKASTWMLVGCQAGDVASTIGALKGYPQHLHEGNPALGRRPSAAKLIAVKAGVTALVYVWGRWMAREHEELANGLTKLLAVKDCGITAWNVSQIVRAGSSR